MHQNLLTQVVPLASVKKSPYGQGRRTEYQSSTRDFFFSRFLTRRLWSRLVAFSESSRKSRSPQQTRMTKKKSTFVIAQDLPGQTWPENSGPQWTIKGLSYIQQLQGGFLLSTSITLTPQQRTTPIVYCHGLCFRDHLQCFGSEELPFSNSLTQGDIYLKTWLQQLVHALRIT